MKNVTIALAVAACALAPTAAHATTTILTPPMDSTGEIYSKNANDGYNQGRGTVFSSPTDVTLTGIALYQDLTNRVLNFSLQSATLAGRTVTAISTLASGSRQVTTNGLEFIEFSTNVNLTANTLYFLNFSFTGISNQGFYYVEGESPTGYSTGGFNNVNSTLGLNTSNSVIPRIRLTTAVAAVPEPATWAMMLLGFGMVAGAARYRRRSANVSFA